VPRDGGKVRLGCGREVVQILRWPTKVRMAERIRTKSPGIANNTTDPRKEGKQFIQGNKALALLANECKSESRQTCIK